MSAISSAGVTQVQGDKGGEESNEDDTRRHDAREMELILQPRMHATSAPAYKTYTSLATLADMPLDIFIEIAAYLMPIDIISLARLTKSIRSKLMHRSSIHVWHTVMKNLEILPDCPPDMSEPRYLSFLFSETCTACGESVEASPDWVLRVRLCGPCRTEHPVQLVDVPPRLRQLLSWFSNDEKNFILRRVLDEITATHEKLSQLGDSQALLEWTKERERILDARRRAASRLACFLMEMEPPLDEQCFIEHDRRWAEIDAQLLAMGWESEDMDFENSWSTKQHEWRELVEEPRSMDDQCWEGLVPQMASLCEINRNDRLQFESETRQRARADCLGVLMSAMKHRDFSALGFDVELQFLSSGAESTTTATYRPPFPDFNQALELPVFKRLYETDVSLTEMEETFPPHEEEIKSHVIEWQNRIHGYFLDLLCAGDYTPGPATGIDAFSLSDDLGIILRADVLFCNLASNPVQRRTPVTYDALSSDGDLISSLGHKSSWSAKPGLPYLGHIVLYPKAQKIARALLVNMGIPNASCLEMQGYGANLACGRCHDTSLRSWTDLVRHYIQANERYAVAQVSQFEDGITYNHVHDPALYTERPLVIHQSTMPSVAKVKYIRVCVLCEKLSVKQKVVAPKSTIFQHLLDVHDVGEPVAGEHYRQIRRA